MNDDERYAKLLSAGTLVVRDAAWQSGRHNNQAKVDFKALAAAAGCSSARVGEFLETGKGNISGKDWERLITYCSVPEKWIYMAGTEVPKDFESVPGAGANNNPPSQAVNSKISNVLATASWFYQEATRRFLAASLPAK